MRRWVLSCALGGALCLLFDHLHVVFGVLRYAHPTFWRQAPWTFPLFFGATFVVVYSAGLVAAPGASRWLAVKDSISFFAAYGFTALAAPVRSDVVLAVLVLAWVARALRALSARELAFCAALGVLGSAFEGSLSATGAFAYDHPDLFDVPRWLPALYLHAGVAGLSVRRMLGNPPIRP